MSTSCQMYFWQDKYREVEVTHHPVMLYHSWLGSQQQSCHQKMQFFGVQQMGQLTLSQIDEKSLSLTTLQINRCKCTHFLLILIGHLYLSGGWSSADLRMDTWKICFKIDWTAFSKSINHSRLNSQHNWEHQCGLLMAPCQWTLRIHND